MEFQAELFKVDSIGDNLLATYVVHTDMTSLNNYYAENLHKNLKLSTHIVREKRSLDANAYYWTMLSKLASKLGNSNNRQHNLLLASYSELEIIDGKVIELEIIESESASNAVMESSEHHLRPTSQLVIKDGDVYRVYQMIKGSSGLDTKAFSRLIDGLLEECKAQGIPTISDDEAERMMAAYGKKCV